MASLAPTYGDVTTYHIVAQLRPEPAPRFCRYDRTLQRNGESCDHCGAPDDGDRGPLMMEPIKVIAT